MDIGAAKAQFVHIRHDAEGDARGAAKVGHFGNAGVGLGVQRHDHFIKLVSPRQFGQIIERSEAREASDVAPALVA
ncbi:MAG: hypothetical protein NTZ05_04635 [Chloroflexi bacterium]|nr:hypothetical protein [Chloroflexota bacterium]